VALAPTVSPGADRLIDGPVLLVALSLSRPIHNGVMNIAELQVKATIAAALIVSHAVEVPRIQDSGDLMDTAAIRLRDLTDYVYRAIVADMAQPQP
jgi:hypothetical protein